MNSNETKPDPTKPDKLYQTEEWQKELTKEQYSICRLKGTEPAFHNQYFNEHHPGIYLCACCGQELFQSEEKFDSETDWPSFTAPSSFRSQMCSLLQFKPEMNRHSLAGGQASPKSQLSISEVMTILISFQQGGFHTFKAYYQG